MTTTNLPLGIEKTSDYTIFKKLEGNRDVSAARVKKIVQSIENVGYIMNPIIVNENYEIIDGQGRFAALRQMGLPVFYVVERGAGVKECVSININQTNWGLRDYFNSYIDQGNDNYYRLQTLLNTYPQMEFRTLLNVALVSGDGGGSASPIKKGTLTFTESDLAEAKLRLNFVSECMPYLCRNGGRMDIICGAIAWAYKYVSFDKARLLSKLKNNAAIFPPAATRMFALQQLEKIYNEKLTGKSRVYFSSEYDRLRSKH